MPITFVTWMQASRQSYVQSMKLLVKLEPYNGFGLYSFKPENPQPVAITPAAWVQASRQSYIKSVELLVELASLQTAFLTLDEAIKTTNRRVNALDSVVKPMLENTIQYIKVRARPHVMRARLHLYLGLE